VISSNSFEAKLGRQFQGSGILAEKQTSTPDPGRAREIRMLPAALAAYMGAGLTGRHGNVFVEAPGTFSQACEVASATEEETVA
jgi:hypothetical protein